MAEPKKITASPAVFESSPVTATLRCGLRWLADADAFASGQPVLSAADLVRLQGCFTIVLSMMLTLNIVTVIIQKKLVCFP